MPRFIFICEHHNAQKQTIDTKVTNEFISESVSDVLVQFECFLRGSGYVFDGTIQYVPNKENPELQETNTVDTVDHNETFYDTERNR